MKIPKSPKPIFIFFILFIMIFSMTSCGPAKEVKSAVDSISIETTLPQVSLEKEISKEEGELLLSDLEVAFDKLVLEIEEKYNYKNYINAHPSPSKLSAGEMKSIYSYYNKIKKSALKKAESEFETNAKNIIAKILELDDKEKDAIWSNLYEKNIAPLNDYIANLGK